MLLRSRCLCLLALLLVLPLSAQTLAHPGWRGNGIAPQSWWKHASFVRIGVDTTFTQIQGTLDAMSQAGIDSMILPDLQPAAGSSLPFNERFGSEGDLDALLREASARRMHVLLTMPVARLSAGNDELRFWMTRGIAGIDVGDIAPGDLSVLRGVHSSMTRFPGERILMARVSDQPLSSRAAEMRHDPISLHLSLPQQQTTEAPGPHVWRALELTKPDIAVPAATDTVLVFPAEWLQHPESTTTIRALLAQRLHRSSRRR